MSRDFNRLRTGRFDVLVIGGGIMGATIAWDATLRGLDVALVERKDYGAATTAGNFKTLHGGLRYLQNFDLPRLRQSVTEQRVFRHIAPHLVRPLPFLVPCYGTGMKSPEILKVGLTIYELLTLDRNRGISKELQLPNHRSLTSDEVLKFAPGIASEGLRGGVVFYDAQMQNADRLTLSFLLSARERGAVLCNYAEVVGAEKKDGKITRVSVRDELSGSTSSIDAKMIVNASGPWSEIVIERLTGKPADVKNFLYSKGLQVIVPQILSELSLAVESDFEDESAAVTRGKRSYFLIPWRGHTLVGTADIIHRGDPDTYRLSQSEVERFIKDVGKAYKSPQLTSQNVKFAFGGLRPIDEAERESIQKRSDPFGTFNIPKRDIVIDHSSSKDESRCENLVSVVGIKYTTARAVSAGVVDSVEARLRNHASRSKSETEKLLGADFDSLEELKAEIRESLPESVSNSAVEELARDFGSNFRVVTDRFSRGGAADDRELLRARVRCAVELEDAVYLSDVLLRRTDSATLGAPRREDVELVALELGKLLGWTPEATTKAAAGCTIPINS